MPRWLDGSRATPLKAVAAAGILALSGAATPVPRFDFLITDGTIYDGSGAPPYVGNIAIRGDRIVGLGVVSGPARSVIDARGLAVSPGFINMLSGGDALIVDGRGMSDTKQGVTLEVMGEGWSMGPLSPTMKADEERRQGDIKYKIAWTTLAEGQDWLARRGVTPNIASFIGAATIRIHELGEGDVDPTPRQLARMQALVGKEMNNGALGIASSLIYAPGSFAEKPELVALMKAAAPCGGMYISHMRSESGGILAAVDELIDIARQSGGPAEIYHLKLAGARQWDKLPEVVAKIEAARAEGLRITTNMYTYAAGATGLTAAMPQWVQAGGLEQWIARLKDPAVRARVADEMKRPGDGWENLYYEAGSADKLLLLGFKNPKLKHLTGKTLTEVARMRGKSPEETAMDLVIEDGSRVGTAYFLMDESNVAKQTALPWRSFGSDSESSAPEGVFLKSSTHPRAYGNFARLLGKYVREERTTTLADAIRRLTSLPAANLAIKDRGALKPGYFADLAIFDPATIGDRATYDKPMQYAVGMRHVFVNGVQVLRDGEHTGALPGRVVRGPGWKRCPAAKPRVSKPS